MKAHLAALAAVLFFGLAAHADTTFSGDAQITGQVGVGTLVPQATLHVQDDATDTYALRVSSPNGAVFFTILPSGYAGIGLTAPQTHMDVNGTGDNGDVALQLRVGDSSNTVLSQQIVFASTTGAYGHAIITQATVGQSTGNAVDFFLWNSTGQPNAAANLEVLSLATPNSSTWSVHIDPVGTPNVQLEVSNGACTGCGTIIRASAVMPSSRERKTDIVYLDEARRKQALEDVKALRHATYRYKRTMKDKMLDEPATPTIRGLIYEDSPASIQGPNKTIVLDNRILNLELALQAVDGKIAALEAEISRIEKDKVIKGGGQR